MKVTTAVSYAFLAAGALGKEEVKTVCGNQRYGELNDSLSCTVNLTLTVDIADNCRLPKRMEQKESQERLRMPQSRQQHACILRNVELAQGHPRRTFLSLRALQQPESPRASQRLGVYPLINRLDIHTRQPVKNTGRF